MISYQILHVKDRLSEVTFYVSLETKQIISETFFPANLLAQHWRN